MKSDKALRDLVCKLLMSGQAHMTFEQAVEDFPAEHYNTRPPNTSYTFWQLVEHIRFCQWDILDYFEHTATYQAPEAPDGYWPAKDAIADQVMWETTVRLFIEERQTLIDLISNPSTDLLAPIPHGFKGDTILRQTFSVADHNAYHIGELGILRQIMGLWPAKQT